MERMQIDLGHKPPNDPGEPLEFVVDPILVEKAREALTARKYAQMMEDATFPPGAILSAKAWTLWTSLLTLA